MRLRTAIPAPNRRPRSDSWGRKWICLRDGSSGPGEAHSARNGRGMELERQEWSNETRSPWSREAHRLSSTKEAVLEGQANGGVASQNRYRRILRLPFRRQGGCGIRHWHRSEDSRRLAQRNTWWHRKPPFWASARKDRVLQTEALARFHRWRRGG